MIAQAVTGTPGHINSMALAMKHFLDVYPLESLVARGRRDHERSVEDLRTCQRRDGCQPGLPRQGLRRLLRLDVPQRRHRRHVLSAEAREVYEEGLFIPIMKLYEGGRLNESLAAIIRANTRAPDLVMGDFHAQVAGGAVGGERLLEFMDEFGFERLEPLADEIVGRTERAMREAIAALRPGLSVRADVGRVRRAAHDRVRCEVRATTSGWTSPGRRRRAAEASTW